MVAYTQGLLAIFRVDVKDRAGSQNERACRLKKCSQYPSVAAWYAGCKNMTKQYQLNIINARIIFSKSKPAMKVCLEKTS